MCPAKFPQFVKNMKHPPYEDYEQEGDIKRKST